MLMTRAQHNTSLTAAGAGLHARRCLLIAGIVALSACPGNFVNPDRPTPVCAVRDCASGKIIDDGCSADGQCLKCSNDCGGKVAPRNGPKSPLLPSR
jgi:hypothetical protein